MQVGFKTDRGMRRHNNEDACFILPSSRVYVVADGVGGGNAGEIASRTAVSQIAGYIDRNPMEPTEDKYKIANYFQHCLDAVNGHIFEMANKYDANRGMATTIVIVYAEHGKAYITNVGDSRAYLCTMEGIQSITVDHSVVEMMVRRGEITREQAKNHPGKNLITRAVGTEPDVESDLYHLHIDKGNAVVLCSDGLSNTMSDQEILFEVVHGINRQDCCQRLVKIANYRGSPDNVTVVLISY